MPDIEQRLIIKAISEGFKQISDDIKGVGSSVDDATKAAKQGTTGWTELASKISVAQQAYGMVSGAAKAAYGELKRGADLEVARSQFENLAASIGTTAESIDTKLKAATSGMMPQAERVAGASQIISLGLAKNETDVVRLAKSVGTLGLDMQQVILTFANNSKARLDSLGLSVEYVTTKAKELEAQGFQGDAFDEAVLQGLEQKMTLLGDASETTAGKLKIMEANMQDLKDASATLFATLAAEPVEQLANVTTGAVGVLDSFKKAEEDLTRAGKLGLITREQYNSALLHGGRVGKAYADLVQEARDKLEDFNAEISLSTEEMEALAPAIKEAAGADEKWLQGIEEATPMIAGLTSEYRAALRVLGEHSPALSQDTREMEDAAYASGELGNAQDRLKGYLEGLPPAANVAAESIAGITAGAEGATRGVGGLNSALDVAMGKSTELVTPLQEIFGAMEQFQAIEESSAKIADMADNQQFAADKAVVLQEKLTGVYTGLEDTGAGAEDATGKVDAYIARLGEIPAEVSTTLIVNQEVRGGGAYGGGNQGYAPANQYAAGSTGNKGESQTYGGSYRPDYDPLKDKRYPQFAEGGVIPGPLGSPQLVIAHGGETVIPPGQNTLSVVQNFYGSSPNTMAQARDGVLDAARAIGLTGYA